jgi:hypothetical protein
MNSSELDECFGTARWEEKLGELTALELHHYMEESEFDVCHYVWTYHVSWGFESNWAWEYTLSEQEKNDFANKIGVPVNKIFEGVPSCYDPNRKLKDLVLWAPQDRL